MRKVILGFVVIASSLLASDLSEINKKVEIGIRPFYLVNSMKDSLLKSELKSCLNKKEFVKSDFVIGHRSSPLAFPEHTKESYIAAAKMGAGVLECDVAFTKDKELVCRHSQCDLHTTTNILKTDLAKKCTQNFKPAKFDENAKLIEKASAKCCTSDITLAEFKTLKGKMDASNPNATNLDEYINATPSWRTDLFSQDATLLSHKESIELFKNLGVKMTPELKSPQVKMPFDGDYTQEKYAQQLPDEWIYGDGNIYELVDVLAQDVGIMALFSDWPATVIFYANCKKTNKEK